MGRSDGGKNLHMTHLEDAVLSDGGAAAVLGVLRGFLAESRKLRKLAKNGIFWKKLSVKWDGSPAIFAGRDPSDGRFFVAKKGVFAKTPRTWKKESEIDADMEGDLALKMKTALEFLPALRIPDGVVLQGDLMFTRNDVGIRNIMGREYAAFHPNTLVYGVPAEDSEPVLNVELGVVWHTGYAGRDFASMKAEYGFDAAGQLASHPAVWSRPADLPPFQKIEITPAGREETAECIRRVVAALGKNPLLRSGVDGEVAAAVMRYGNSFIRRGEDLPEPSQCASRFMEWIEEGFRIELSKRKTERGRRNLSEKHASFLTRLPSRGELEDLFWIQRDVAAAKHRIINSLNNAAPGGVHAFVQKKGGGYEFAGPEGFVYDNGDGNAFKLVNRLEFSHNNFSRDVVKGWEKGGV